MNHIHSLELWPLERLQPFQGNLKKTDKSWIQALANRIQKYGFNAPFFVWKDHDKLLDGHQRLEALKLLNWKDDVPVVLIEAKDEREAKERLLEYNTTYSKIDQDVFEDWSDDLDLDDLNLIGMESLDVSPTVLPEGIDDAPPVPTTPKTKLGDCYQLGRHRLLCGDSTKKEDVERLMDEKQADMVFTDPPYGMKYNPNMSDTLRRKKGNWQAKLNNYSEVIGDEKDFDPSFLLELLQECKEQFWWGADYYSQRIPENDSGSWFVWDKRFGIEDMKWSTSEFELCWSKIRHHRQIVRVTWSGILGTEQEHDHADGRQHPTQKPVKLAAWFLEKFSKELNLILDPFGGSGSTLIACEQTKRICYMMELDPGYCDVIVSRWEKLTGQTAQLLS